MTSRIDPAMNAIARPLAPGFEHSVWIDGNMVGTFHDPAMVVTAPPNKEDAEEEDDEPTVMVAQVGSKTVTTVVAKSRFSEESLAPVVDKPAGGGGRKKGLGTTVSTRCPGCWHMNSTVLAPALL